MGGAAEAMAGRSKNIGFSTSNRGVEVDLEWKNKCFSHWQLALCEDRGVQKVHRVQIDWGVQMLIFHVFLKVFGGRVTKTGQRF